MIERIISALAAFLMLFSFAFPAEPERKEKSLKTAEPAPAESNDRTYDKIEGVEGADFYIARPGKALNTVNASDFGMLPENADNYPALKNALEYCADHPGTRLFIPGGEYYLDNRETLSLSGCENILIESDGAVLVFSNVVTAFRIGESECVEFRNIAFDWDWEKSRLSDVVKVTNADRKNKVLDFIFTEIDDVDENTVLAAVTQCDPDTLTYGAKYSNKEVYFYMDPALIKNVEKVAPNVLRVHHNGCMSNFENGDTFILRHYVYDASFLSISSSRNVTFDGISLFGYPGAGFAVGNRSSHFQIINSYIGVRKDAKQSRHSSLGADAIHIANTYGHFNISGNDISGMGDDALNVHDGLGVVKEISGKKLVFTANAMSVIPGDTIAFRDELFNETDVTAAVEKVSFSSPDYTVELDKDISDKISEGCIVYSVSCDSGNYAVRNNYIHENRARGFLLQSSNGICENNRFYKTQMQAIKIIMDISPGLWYEGTGVDSLEIVNNTFDTCDVMKTGTVIEIGTNIAGERAVSRPFTNITVKGNTFSDMPALVIKADNFNGFEFSSNTVNNGNTFKPDVDKGKLYFGKYSANAEVKDNEFNGFVLFAPVKAENTAVWTRINSKK